MSLQPKVAGKRFPRRLDAMIKRSKDFQQQFQEQEQEPIRRLLVEFEAFSREYISLLKLVPETISRNSFVVNNGIEKLLQEWNMLSRASEQRLIGGFKEQLAAASNLAKTYCYKWNAILLDSSYRKLEMPVVYFEKLFRISRSIYAPQIPVISIPLTDYDQSDNWQSLAHEFSHHIFWNGFSPVRISEPHQKLRQNITSRLFSSSSGRAIDLRQQADRAELWENWLEEVFADVYGTLLDGHAYALSTQDRMAEQVNRLEDFLTADHQHPCVYLRPWISLYTLDAIAAQWKGGQEEIDELKQRWSIFSDSGSRLKYKDIPLTTLAEDARRVVEIILCDDYWPVKFDPVGQLAGPITRRVAGVQALEAVVDQDPLGQIYDDLNSIMLPTKFEEIKEQLLETSTRLVQQLGLGRAVEDAKLLTWLSLTGLELSDANDYHVHGCTDDHRHAALFWVKRHYHPQDGSSVFAC